MEESKDIVEFYTDCKAYAVEYRFRFIKEYASSLTIEEDWEDDDPPIRFGPREYSKFYNRMNDSDKNNLRYSLKWFHKEQGNINKSLKNKVINVINEEFQCIENTCMYESEDVRESIALFLEKYNRIQPSKSLYILEKLATDESSRVRSKSVDAIGEMGEINPLNALSILKHMIDNGERDFDVKESIAYAIAKIGQIEPHIVLLLLKNPFFNSESEALILGKIGEVNPAIVMQRLKELSKVEYWRVREYVARAVIKIDSISPQQIPLDFKKWAKDELSEGALERLYGGRDGLD